MELISPTREYASSKNAAWRISVNQIFDSLTKFNIKTNKSCATHVHLSPMSEPWRMKDLHKLGCCILFFEDAMENLYPENVRQNEYAVANGVDNPAFGARALGTPKGLQNCFRAIFKTETKDEFIHLLNKGGTPAVPYKRYYGWNFTNLTSDGIGTVEFRRPPGVTQSDTCQNWVDLAVAFITAATGISNTEDLFKKYPDRNVNNLKRFLETALPNGSSADGHFGNLFNDVGGRIDMGRIQQRLGG